MCIYKKERKGKKMTKQEIINFIEEKRLDLKLKLEEGSKAFELIGLFEFLLELAIDELKKESVKK